MNDSMGERADAQHPWIGLASFTEGDRSFFAGRGDEIDDLLRLVRRDTLTLLYGVSGLGKTSLVQAGLFPALREENFLPVPIRLDYLEGALSLAHQIINAITAAAMAARVEAPRPRPDETLWEYFHREGNHFWSARNDLVTPFLAFDQFEELFTLGRETPARTAAATAFIIELADLVEDRPPAALRDDRSRAKGFNFKPAPLKVLLAMREDYLADLDRIRSHFRALGQNRLRLLPMGERQARQVIALGAPLLAPGVEDRIVKYVAGAAPDAAEMTVAPALLSLVLRELNERRLARGPEAKITSDLLDVEQHKIFEDFYLRTLADFPPGVRLFIEDELLTASGHRNSAALDDALTRPDVTLPVLNELVNRRLLAYEDRHHTRRVELTHDVLVPVIKASRDSRLTREALAQAERLRAEQVAQRRRQRLTLVVACALALTLVATIWGAYYLFVQEHKAYYSEFAKRSGFPIGVTQVSESQARRLAVSFLLVHKGITREGWKWRWKPAFRMVAVDSRLKPTTNHSVGTYLWKKGVAAEDAGGDQSQKRAERLGLLTVCQWEFDSNAQGEIIYERALDRDGRMVYGFIYSPHGSGRPDTRLARFVGPEGFPQLQAGSEAEYVLIHYEPRGWEDRITYHDGKNFPAAGPDRAYGQSRAYNPRGQLMLVLSLDADGKNMIDSAGNCGMQLIYNEKGCVTEERSLGPDLKPMPLKVGWTVAKATCDDLGRSKRATYHGTTDEPVVRDGYHGWEAEYDEHGNQVTFIYMGLDGKPTLLDEGFASYRSTYNADGKVTRMSYHNVKGDPTLHKDGCQAWEVQYDERGNEVVRSYIGLDGKPTLTVYGIASQRSIYNAQGTLTQTSYYGVKGEPVSHKNGYHAWEERDERGNKTVTTYLGPDGKPVVIPAGYASFEKTYDSDGNSLEVAYFDAAGQPAVERKSLVHRVKNSYDGRGKVIRKRFHGINGEAVLHMNGFHGWDAQYDDRGNLETATYVGLDSKPILLPEGYSISKSIFNAKGKATQTNYYGVNGEPVLYKDGYHAWKADYDDRGNEIEETYFDSAMKPIIEQTSRVHKMLMTYNRRGNVTRKRYFGPNGEAFLHKEGYHGWDGEYDDRGNAITITYIGLDEKPMLHPSGYATVKSVYDVNGKATRTSYYGVNDEPVNSKKFYHAWEARYDELGNEIEETYFDTAGKPTLEKEFRVHKVLIDYDSRGNEIRKRFRGTRDKAILHRDRHHGWDAQYDDHGYQISITYVGLDEKPILLPARFATVKSVYNAAGKRTRMSLYGVRGEPVLHKDGHHGWISRYDDRGWEVESTHFGLDEKPILLEAGYATVKWIVDARGRKTQETYYGINDERVLNKNGYHGSQTQYDERGHKIALTYLGLDEKPALLAAGYAIEKSKYDVRGNLIRLTYHGVNGEPVLHKNGNHGWERVLDERQNEIERTYMGLDGRPILLGLGYATAKVTYDAQGRIAQVTYHGVNGEPILRKGGYHRWKANYNKLGQETDKVYFDLDGKVVTLQKEQPKADQKEE